MSSVKILIDARSLGHKPSGIGIYVYNFVQVINNFEQCAVVLLTDVAESTQMRSLKNEGIRIIEKGTTVRKNLDQYSYFRFVQEKILEEKPDLFWECNTITPIPLYNPYGRMCFTVHDVFPISSVKSYGLVYSLYFRFGLNNSIKYFDTVIYDSLESKQQTEHYFPQVKHLESVIGSVIVSKPPELALSNNNSFLYIGNLEYRKGTDILLQEYEKYKANGGSKKLRLAGKVREKGIEKLLNNALDKDKDILYLGYLTDDRKYAEYASCDSFVFPSRAEGFGIPVIEAMYYRKPVICSKLSIFDEIAGDCIVKVDFSELHIYMAKEYKVDSYAYEECIEKYRPNVVIDALSRQLTPIGRKVL